MSIASSKTVANGDTIDRQKLQVLVNQAGEVDMTTAVQPLAEYLRDHPNWIDRCFKPLTVTPLSETSYRLQFFRMGGLGFELEPHFGIQIGSEGDTLFYLNSIELPGDAECSYKVNCHSEFRLEERHEGNTLITRVYWTLHLDIVVQLPKFVQVLPRKRVKSVAEGIVSGVARRMCDRLTQNICKDYAKHMDQTED